MTQTTSDIRSPAMREKLRRMALWALLGAASGAAPWVLGWVAGVWGVEFGTRVENDLLTLILPRYAPGITFGLVIGLALFARGYARLWQAALFAVLSVPAWYAGLYVGRGYGLDLANRLNADSLYLFILVYFVIGVVGGTAWAIAQTLAVAPLSFARRVRVLATLVAVGAVTGGLLLVASEFVGVGFFNDTLFLILWTGWYAVYAAVLSLFLPWPKSAARPEENGAG